MEHYKRLQAPSANDRAPGQTSQTKESSRCEACMKQTIGGFRLPPDFLQDNDRNFISIAFAKAALFFAISVEKYIPSWFWKTDHGQGRANNILAWRYVKMKERWELFPFSRPYVVAKEGSNGKLLYSYEGPCLFFLALYLPVSTAHSAQDSDAWGWICDEGWPKRNHRLVSSIAISSIWRVKTRNKATFYISWWKVHNWLSDEFWSYQSSVTRTKRSWRAMKTIVSCLNRISGHTAHLQWDQSLAAEINSTGSHYQKIQVVVWWPVLYVMFGLNQEKKRSENRSKKWATVVWQLLLFLRLLIA